MAIPQGWEEVPSAIPEGWEEQAPNEGSEELKKRLKAAGGGLEAVGAMASGIPGMIAGGIHGLGNYITPGSGAFGDIDESVRRMQAVQNVIPHYEPQSEYGKLATEGLGEAGDIAKNTVGQAGYAVAGEPGRYAAESLGGMAAALAPIPGGKFVRALGKGFEREFGAKPITKINREIPEPVIPKEIPAGWEEVKPPPVIHVTPEGEAFDPRGNDMAFKQAAEDRMRALQKEQPLEMESPYPADIEQFPQVLKDAPTQVEGLDATQHVADTMARPLEQDIANPPTRPEIMDWEGEGGGQAITSHNPVPGAASAAAWARMQRGAIDVQAVKEAIDKYKAGRGSSHGILQAYQGAFHPDELEFMQRAIDNPGNRNAVVLMSPDEFHNFAAARSPEYMSGSIKGMEHPEELRQSIREGLKSPKGLMEMPQLFTKTQNGIAQVNGHEGRHRMDVFKEMGIDKVPVLIRDAKESWGNAHTLVPESEYEIPQAHERQGQPFPLILNNRLRVPENMRGAIDLGPTASPPARLTKNDPEVVKAKAVLDQRSKEKIVNDILGNPYVDNITTPEEALAAAQSAKDIGAVAAARMKSVGSGVNSATLSSNNPVIKFTRYVVRKAEKAADNYAEKFITGKDGLAVKWQKLSAGERNDVMAILQKQDRAQRWYTPLELDEAGFNAKQIDAILHVQKMEKVKLEVWNEKRAEVGLPAVEEMPGHFPGNFTGDYRTIVLDAKGHTIGYVGTNTKWGHKKVIEGLKKEYPDARFESLGRKNLAGRSRTADSVAMSELAKVMSEHSPEFAELQERVQRLIATNADKLYGADQHALGKKGGKDSVFGSEGNKPWKNATENTNEAMTAYKNYWDEGMRSHQLLPAHTQITQLLNSPDLAHMPNARSYVEKYMNHLTGRSVADFGRAMDTLLDALPKIVGVGPSYVRGAINQTTKRVGQLLMGYGNLGHTAVQMLQVPAMAVPQFVNIAKQFNIPMTQLAVHQAAGIKDVGGFIKEMITGEPSWRDSNTRAAMDFAAQNGMRHFSEFQDISRTEQSATSRVADQAIDLNRTVPEVTTRPFAFFTIFRMLEDVPHLTLEQKLSAALNATDEAMINYAPREKPMVYGDMGQIGKLTGSLSTFKHGAIAQAGRLAKGVGKGNIAPAATMAATMFALAGARGIFGYDDADSIVKAVTAAGGDRRSIRELILDPNIESEVVKSGALSAYTGLDLAGRVNVNGFIPENPAQAVIGPFGTKIAKVGERVVQAGKEAFGKGNGPIDFKNLALELMPGGVIHHNARETMMNDPKTNRLIGQDGLPSNDRSDFDITANKWGMTSLKQGNLTNSQYNDSQRFIAKKADQKTLEQQAMKLHDQDLFANSDGSGLTPRGQAIMQKYIARDGNPETLITKLVSESEKGAQNKQQRLQGIPTDAYSAKRYQDFQRSRKYNNAN